MKKFAKITAIVLTFALLLSSLSLSVFADDSADYTDYINETPKIFTYYEMTNPYAGASWSNQYKANLHTHTTVSLDSSEPVRNQVETYYAAGYDIVSINDHANTSKDWDKYTSAQGAVSVERAAEIHEGVDRDGRGMVQIPLSNEQNGLSNHVLSYFADYNAGLLANNYNTVLTNVNNRGGFTFFAHPGRYTSAPATQAQISSYANMLLQYPNSAMGYEIFGVNDGETKNERYLWDRTLMITAPQGKNVFGISNDDAHSTSAVGRSGWTMFVMSENTVENIRTAMGTGSFYASAMMAVDEGIDARNSGLPTPIISSITTDGNIITVEGDYYDTIEWIADGVKIAAGNTIDLLEYKEEIGSYIRFQLKGDGGISWANPILLKRVDAELVDITVEAFVTKLSGNQNELTITITEIYENDKINVITEIFKINNNAAGIYDVGEYKVYVDTKGNTQIRACYIVGDIITKEEIEIEEIDFYMADINFDENDNEVDDVIINEVENDEDETDEINNEIDEVDDKTDDVDDDTIETEENDENEIITEIEDDVEVDDEIDDDLTDE